MLGTTPAAVSRGAKPARTSDDLPAPLAPSMSSKAHTPLGRVLQPVYGFGDIAAAAEEDRRVLGAENVKAAERRPLDFDRPHDRAAAQDLLVEPFAQQRFDLGPGNRRSKQRMEAALNWPLGVRNQVSKKIL